jgi:hypothetical protein
LKSFIVIKASQVIRSVVVLLEDVFISRLVIYRYGMTDVYWSKANFLIDYLKPYPFIDSSKHNVHIEYIRNSQEGSIPYQNIDLLLFRVNMATAIHDSLRRQKSSASIECSVSTYRL